MKKLTSLLVCLVAMSAQAAFELDARFALRQMVLGVVNPNTRLVYSDGVEAYLAERIKKDSRFDWPPEAFVYTRQTLRAVPPISLGYPGRENVMAYAPLLQQVSGFGVDSALLAEVQKDPEGYKVFLTLVTLPMMDKVQSEIRLVENSESLESFQRAAGDAFDAIMASLPFDNSVLTREGYRVVLDVGDRRLKPGMRLPVYTIEVTPTGLNLDETGVVQLTRVEGRLSFAEVVVERRPREVAAGNKLRWRGAALQAQNQRSITQLQNETPAPIATTLPNPEGRQPASVATSSADAGPLPAMPRLGGIDLDAVGTFVSWSRTGRDGTRQNDSSLFPGASVRADIWVTSKIFGDIGFAYGSGKLSDSGESLTAQMMRVRLQAGYRFNLARFPSGPSISVRAGYGRTAFTASDSIAAGAPSSVTYSGLLTSASFDIPLGSSWNAGLEFDAMMFGSAKEGTFTSGKVNGMSIWSVSVGVDYHWFDSLSAVMRLGLQTANTDFTGTGTRPTALASSTQDTQSVGLGLKYYF